MRALTGPIINNTWWYVFKRTIRFESIQYSIDIVKKKTRIKRALFKAVEEALKSAWIGPVW